MTKFEEAMAFVLKHEGGYVFDPSDPGGETRYGIAKRSHPNVDIKNLTLQGALDIYLKEYWNCYQLEQLTSPLTVVVMDSYVQHNPNKVKQFITDAKGDWNEIISHRRIYYLQLIEKNPTLFKFKNGWMARLTDLSKYCQIISQEQQ